MAMAALVGTVACATDPVDGRWPTSAPPSGWIPIGGSTRAAPAAVEHDGVLYVFLRGEDGRIQFDASVDDRTWQGFQSIDGLTTDVGPAAVVFRGALRVFARSSADGGIYEAASTSLGGAAWVRVLDATTAVAPAVAAFDGKLYLLTVGAEDHAIHWSTTTDGEHWSPFVTRGQRTSTSPATAVLDGKLAFFWVDEVDGDVHVATSGDGDRWVDAEPLSAQGLSPKAVSAGTFGDDLYVTITDADTGHVFSNVTRSPLRWGGWFEVPPKDLSTDVAVGTLGVADGFRWFARSIDDGVVRETRTPIYRLPFLPGDGWRVATGNCDDPTAGHGPGDYSFDLAHAEDGVTVHAMRDGHVVLSENAETCGFFEDWQCLDADHCCSVISKQCMSGGKPNLGNVVMIQHDDGTVASYNHLAPGTIPESVRACGALVRQGDVVGKVGHTGLVCGPSHVHVGVLSAWNNTNGACAWGTAGYPDMTGIDRTIPMLPIYFGDQAHQAWRPIVGDPLAP